MELSGGICRPLSAYTRRGADDYIKTSRDALRMLVCMSSDLIIRQHPRVIKYGFESGIKIESYCLSLHRQ